MRIYMPGRILRRHVGGNTTYASRLAQGLAARDIEVRIVPEGSRALSTLVRESLFSLRALGPESVLHWVADTGPLLPTRTASVTTVHGVASRWIETARTPSQEKVWRLRVSKAIQRSRRILTVSQSSAEDISDVFGVPMSKINVIPHGVDRHLFAREHRISVELTKRVPPEFMLYVGNIEPRKNLQALIRAVNLLPTQSRIPLVIVGRPAWNYKATMVEIEQNPGSVVHLGFVSESEKVALMQACKLFVFPSLYEGFGFPVLEAMAAGARVLTSSRGSLSEVAGPAHRVDDLDAAGLAIALEDALAEGSWSNDYPRLASEWVKRFDWERSVESHISVYRQVLG